MNLFRYLLTSLPESLQNRITLWLISSGMIFTTPIWKMLFQTLNFYGGDEEKIRKTLVRKHDNGVESVIIELCDLGTRTKEEADQLCNTDAEAACDAYLEAAMYYFAGLFFVNDNIQSAKIFSQATPVFDEFRRLHDPPVQKWEFDYKEKGKFFAHVYTPPHDGKGTFPVVLVYPGNEGIKEHMVTYAGYAARRGMALVAIDPPGWGESGLTGCLFSSVDDYRECTQQLYDRMLTEPFLDTSRIATFGVSGGSLTSVIVAGLVNFVKAVSGIGAPEYDKLAQVWKNALAEQQRKTYTWTGLTTKNEVVALLEQYASDAEDALRNVECSVLLVHGEKDLITRKESGKDIAGLIGKNASYRIIPGDDHLCSNNIGSGLADDIFDWLAAKLQCDGIAQ